MCNSIDNHSSQTRTAHRRITHHFLVLTNQWKHPWMEWVVSVCPTFIWKQCYLVLIFSWDLYWNWELNKTYLSRLERVWALEEEKAVKGKASRNEGLELLWPKILLCGQRQCGCPLFFLPKSRKNDPRGRVRQGMRRQGAREQEFFIPTESAALHFTI